MAKRLQIKNALVQVVKAIVSSVTGNTQKILCDLGKQRERGERGMGAFDRLRPRAVKIETMQYTQTRNMSTEKCTSYTVLKNGYDCRLEFLNLAVVVVAGLAMLFFSCSVAFSVC